MVRKFTLSDGKVIPALGWGSGTGGLASSGSKATDMGVVALKAGILHIDTAQLYRTEAEAMASIRKAGMKKEDVWVTDKISENTVSATTSENIRQSINDSLKKLEFIPDMFLIHNPYVPDKGKIGPFWLELEALVKDGTLKGCSLGVSNFRPQDLEEVFKVCTIKPVVNQLEYHPYVLAHLEPLIKIQDEHGIRTQAFGPLGPVLRHPTGGPLKPILTRIAKTLSDESGQEVDEAGVLLIWTMNKGVCAITTSTRESNILKMAALEKVRDLTPEEIAEIDETGKKIHSREYDEHMFEDFPAPNLPRDS